MKPTVYYNEHDRQKAAWLRQLIEEGAIAHGVVDERPIQQVEARDLRGFAQCHFFAGVGVWSYALRLAGVADDEPWWTGSCPCGPFSRAGKQEGFADPRHLWPVWLPLIRECRPHRIAGEQSDAADAWVDLVSTDLEDCGYAIGSPDIPAAGFGGHHIRQRFYWLADADNAEWWSERAPWHDGHWPQTGRVKGDRHPGHGGAAGGMADADGGLAGNGGLQRCGEHGQFAQDRRAPGGLGHANDERGDGRATVGGKARRREPAVAGAADRLGDSFASGFSDADLGIIRRSGWRPERGAAEQPGNPSGSGVDWLFCRDSRWRPVESGTCPLVDASPARMGRLRGYGDAIDAQAAANFIGAYLDASPALASPNRRAA